MNLDTLYDRLTTLQNLARAKFPTASYHYLTVEVNYGSLSPYKVHFNIEKVDGPKLGYPTTVEELGQALTTLGEWLTAIPDWDKRQQQEAVANLGQAIDQCRDTGLDMDAFAAPFAGIYENLLPCN